MTAFGSDSDAAEHAVESVDSVESYGSYSVRLPVFEGPLDLLLHLIRINEVEITDIPIARIGEQYLEYLALMRELDLEVVGEYLVLASTLAWIKSRMLLPAERIGEDGEEIDPRAELVARLLEYQRFKQAAAELGARKRLGRDVFAANGFEAPPPAESEREIEVGLFDLIEAYRRVVAAKRDLEARPHEIESEEVTVRERMLAVMRALESAASLEFEALICEAPGRAYSRALVVATFLAVLELTRLAALRIYQGLNEMGMPEGPIHLRRAVEPGDTTWMDRIADLM
ncbi:MAG TPA: segregation/condensation protein A [Myxococcota bacterium]|nr:segregation/condensation protein A [Myxococcota bacterium]